ncbi:hypothetical protein [Rubripirellula tenax]|nr:hypothetical protein [Rubripirellula tenax]
MNIPIDEASAFGGLATQSTEREVSTEEEESASRFQYPETG